ncbi:MAG: hypothetical protein WC988_02680 [Patescibacteria group bacterium]
MKDQLAQSISKKKTSGSVLVVVLVVFVAVLLAVIVAGVLYFVVLKGNNNTNQVVPVSNISNTLAPASAQPVQPIQPQVPLQTAGTQFKGVTAILTDARRNGRIVTVKFKLKASSNAADLQGKLYGNCGSEDPTARTAITKICAICAGDYSAGCIGIGKQDTPYALDKAYIVDEVDQMKYEVIKDANDKLLASEPVLDTMMVNQEISFFVQFTAPPTETKTITINLPKVQPFIGVEIK